MQEDDILILASDGLSDNLWDTDILDEVVRFRRSFMSPASSTSKADVSAPAPPAPSTTFRRSTLAGMLSEALCSRAKRVSETRGARRSVHSQQGKVQAQDALGEKKSGAGAQVEIDVPFARRAREQGKLFEGGKPDGESSSLRIRRDLV